MTRNKKDRAARLRSNVSLSLSLSLKQIEQIKQSYMLVEKRIAPYADVDTQYTGLVAQSRGYPQYIGDNCFQLEDGTILRNVHYHRECQGRGCAIHHPSDHPLANAELKWQNGHPFRICSHGAVHWDADDIAYRRSVDPSGGYACLCRCNCCGLQPPVHR